MNFSDQEIETAKKAACQRGEKLQIIPKNYKDYTQLIQKVEAAKKKYKGCKENCQTFSEEYRRADVELYTALEASGSVQQQIKKELNDIKNNKGKLTNLILSGHDGGGTFGGHKGFLNKFQLDDILKEYTDINDVSTLMLLGCYTGVQKEISFWKSVFPKVKMIAGYDGSAPLSDKPMGHHYLEDLLTKEKSLLKQADEKQLNQYVSANIRGLHSMYTAVYVESCTEEDADGQGMYYGSLSTNRRFKEFKLDECVTKKAQIKSIDERFSKFDSGEIEPPKNPSDPAIKRLYDEARSLEHCIDQLNSQTSVNSIFNIRFYGDVKENFAKYYDNEIKKADAVIKEMDIDNLILQFNKYVEGFEKDAEVINTDIEEVLKDPQPFIKKIEPKLKAAKGELDAILKDQSKVDLLNKMQDPLYKASSQDEKLFQTYQKLKEDISYYDSLMLNGDNGRRMAAIMSANFNQRKKDANQTAAILNQLRQTPTWAPTSENLKKYSRKELRDNLHRASAVLTIPSIPRELRLALRWSVDAQSEHLIHFQNPFEWHEVTTTVAAPEKKITMGTHITPKK